MLSRKDRKRERRTTAPLKSPKAAKGAKGAKTSKAAKGAKGGEAEAAASVRSVGARGLPLGSLAEGRGGFELRSLDGVAPLLTSEAVRRALKMLAAGQTHAAARELRVDADCVPAFCREACRALGVATPQGAALQAGALLSAAARARLENGLAPPDSDLPGRILVVAAGTATCEATGEPLCPPGLVDRVFGSAAELHAHTAVRLATYELCACADPAFVPWTTMAQRLTSAGLLPAGDESDDTPAMHPRRPLVVRVAWDGGESELTAVTSLYHGDMLANPNPNLAKERDEEFRGSEVVWALVEGCTRTAPPLLLGVPARLLVAAAAATTEADADVEAVVTNSGTAAEATAEASAQASKSGDGAGGVGGPGDALLPALSSEVCEVRLPASQLQKALRRGFCSTAPLLEASAALLRGSGRGGGGDVDMRAPRGGPLAMLSTTWRCMLVDASPFDAPADGGALGLEQLLALSLVARADAGWTPPAPLARRAVAAALRTQKRPSNQWLGFLDAGCAPGAATGLITLEAAEALPAGPQRRAAQLRNNPTLPLAFFDLARTLENNCGIRRRAADDIHKSPQYIHCLMSYLGRRTHIWN